MDHWSIISDKNKIIINKVSLYGAVKHILPAVRTFSSPSLAITYNTHKNTMYRNVLWNFLVYSLYLILVVHKGETPPVCTHPLLKG